MWLTVFGFLPRLGLLFLVAQTGYHGLAFTLKGLFDDIEFSLFTAPGLLRKEGQPLFCRLTSACSGSLEK
jgi:hypothetical protein